LARFSEAELIDLILKDKVTGYVVLEGGSESSQTEPFDKVHPINTTGFCVQRCAPNKTHISNFLKQQILSYYKVKATDADNFIAQTLQSQPTRTLSSGAFHTPSKEKIQEKMLTTKRVCFFR